jgi:hypothetical protein
MDHNYRTETERQMEPIPYEVLKPYWSEWKRSSRPRTDPEEAERLSGMKNIFLSIAGHPSGPVDAPALEFVRSRLSAWKESLRTESNRENTLLFRGIVDDEAIAARSASYTLPVGVPISFAFTEGAARGFAGRGHIAGALVSASVPLSSVVFCDREGFFREGNAEQEAEVVVVLSEPLTTVVLESSVGVRKPWVTSKTGLRLWEEEAERLRSREASMVAHRSAAELRSDG